MLQSNMSQRKIKWNGEENGLRTALDGEVKGGSSLSYFKNVIFETTLVLCEGRRYSSLGARRAYTVHIETFAEPCELFRIKTNEPRMGLPSASGTLSTPPEFSVSPSRCVHPRCPLYRVYPVINGCCHH